MLTPDKGLTPPITLNPWIPVYRFLYSPHVSDTRYMSPHMNFDTGTIKFQMLNGTEVFFSFQPNFRIVGDCFHLVEELFFNHQCFVSAKK